MLQQILFVTFLCWDRKGLKEMFVAGCLSFSLYGVIAKCGFAVFGWIHFFYSRFVVFLWWICSYSSFLIPTPDSWLPTPSSLMSHTLSLKTANLLQKRGKSALENYIPARKTANPHFTITKTQNQAHCDNALLNVGKWYDMKWFT